MKDANYFHAGGDAPMDVVDKVLTAVEALMEKLEGLELHEFAGAISATKGDATKIKDAFVARGANL